MGLLSTIKSSGLDERGFAFVDDQGRHQASMPVNFMDGEGVVAEIEVLRGELSRILYEATRSDAEYLFDNSIDSLVQDQDGVQATLVNGPPRRFHLVIGADGVHSRVRMWGAPDFYFDLIAQVRVARWTRGRVALLGDAGYSPSPVTGLGTSLSLVGAYVLGGELARSGGAYDAAFGRYESVLRDYVKQCQALPPGGLEGILPRTQAAIWMRTMSMRMMLRWPVRNLVSRMFHRAEAIALDDYSATALPELSVSGSS